MIVQYPKFAIEWLTNLEVEGRSLKINVVRIYHLTIFDVIYIFSSKLKYLKFSD